MATQNECFPTDGTLLWFLPSVYVTVLLNTFSLIECLMTDSTLIGFLPSMYTVVCLEVSSTDAFLLSLCRNVYLLVTSLSENLLTDTINTVFPQCARENASSDDQPV